VGECACVSVHGSNRLGGNSLLDLVVFGRAAGKHVEAQLSAGLMQHYVSDDDIDSALSRYHRWLNTPEGESVPEISDEMKKIMQTDFGVFRSGEFMQKGLEKLSKLRERLQQAALRDTSKVFNTALTDALELDNLMLTAMATAVSALNRTESRGAHSREDYPKRDDENWIKHSLYFPDDHIDYRAVNRKPKFIDPFEPKERVY